jgi:hypothetical protein
MDNLDSPATRSLKVIGTSITLICDVDMIGQLCYCLLFVIGVKYSIVVVNVVLYFYIYQRGVLSNPKHQYTHI